MKVGVHAVRSTGSMVATADPLLGTEVRRFKLTRLVGRGGMGRVYEGVQEAIGSRVAIKVIAEQYAQDAEHAERFFAEARAVNMIRHDGIVNIFDLDRLPDGRPVIVMELVEGQTLRQRMQEGMVPLGGLVSVIDQVLGALHAAHAIGVVHRDLKPDNIMIMPSGRTKVLDFGIAKLLAVRDGERPAPRTRTGVVLGTPEYMAPEQIDEGIADARTDVYALGIVLFEAITGRRPFDGPSDYAIMRAQVETPPPSVRSLRADVPDELDQVVARALAKRPRDRFNNAKAMADALVYAARALPPEQWRALSRNGVAIRRHVEAAPAEPAADDSLPTAPRISPAAELPTLKQTPGAREAGRDALRSSHHTADVARVPLAQRNPPTRPSEPAPPSVPRTTRASRRIVVIAAFGVAAIAAAAAIGYCSRTQPASQPVATADDAAGGDTAGTAVADSSAVALVPADAAVVVTAVIDAAVIADKGKHKPARADAAVSSTIDAPAKYERWHGPIPEQYKAISGIEIEPSDYYITTSRVKLKQPYNGDVANVDLAYLASTAKQLARRFESDAELTEIQAVVNRDGSLRRMPLVYFASRQAVASNDDGRLACIDVQIDDSTSKPTIGARGGNQRDCASWPAARVPKCSLTQIAKRLPGDDDWYWLTYNANGWRVGHKSNGAIIAELADDC